MREVYCPAPYPSYRYIPSRFPPIPAFDTVATAADAEAVMELEGWTSDRLVSNRVARLPKDEWVYGIPNASIVMASFLHCASAGNRFNGPELGAWYASAAETTGLLEVAHHLRRETQARGTKEERRTYRCYSARLIGDDYRDIRGCQTEDPKLYSVTSYAASQTFGEAIRESGKSGIIYDSVRHAGGFNIVAHRPRHVTEITQTTHYEIMVPVKGRIIARQLAACDP